MEDTVDHARLPILNTPRGASCGKGEPNGIIEALLENASHSLTTLALEISRKRESTSGISIRMLNLGGQSEGMPNPSASSNRSRIIHLQVILLIVRYVPEEVDRSELFWLDVPGKSEQEVGDRKHGVFGWRWSTSYQPDCAKLEIGLSKLVMNFYSDRIAHNYNDVYRIVDLLLDPIGKLWLCGWMSKKRFAVMFDQLSDFQAAGLLKLTKVKQKLEQTWMLRGNCLISIVNGSESANSSCLP